MVRDEPAAASHAHRQLEPGLLRESEDQVKVDSARPPLHLLPTLPGRATPIDVSAGLRIAAEAGAGSSTRT
jgi:hypothetical protein